MSVSPPPAPEITHLTLRVPASFHFWRTVYSHGWCALLPFSHDVTRQQLDRVLRLVGGTLVHCSVRAGKGGVGVTARSRQPLTDRERQEVKQQLRLCLRVDEDFTAFHAVARRLPAFRWVAAAGAGRLLRSPTVFEDAVKMICTTNCTWRLTTLMVENLVRVAGDRFEEGLHAFPTPSQLAALGERTVRDRVKAGYRSPYILDLARAVTSGALDLEGWRTSSLPTPELYQAMRRVKGIGPYAAGNLLKLVGRYDELGLDAWVRKKFGELHRNGRKASDRTIARHYHPLGQWRGLFFWLEMTRDWQERKFVL